MMSNMQISPVSGILRKSAPVKKKVRKSISFRDHAGEELVECFEVPKIVYDDDDTNSVHDRPKFEATKGKYISMHAAPDPVYNWILVELELDDIQLPNPTSQSFLTEQRRLIELGIVSPPLFGTFEVVDDPQLAIDAAMRAYKSNIPVIPCGVMPKSRVPASQIRDLPLPTNKKKMQSGSAGQEFARLAEPFLQTGAQKSPEVPQKNVYAQEHDASTQEEYIYIAQMGERSGSQYVCSTPSVSAEAVYIPTPEPSIKVDKMANLFSLMEKLKQKGLMPTEQASPPPPSVFASDNNGPNNYEPVYPVQNNNNKSIDYKMMNYGGNGSAEDGDRRQPRRLQAGYLINEHCTYFMLRDRGCHRGDLCRFLHDEKEREKRRLEKAEKVLKAHAAPLPGPSAGPPPPPGCSRPIDRRDENWRDAPPPRPIRGGFQMGRRYPNRPPPHARRYSRSPIRNNLPLHPVDRRATFPSNRRMSRSPPPPPPQPPMERRPIIPFPMPPPPIARHQSIIAPNPQFSNPPPNHIPRPIARFSNSPLPQRQRPMNLPPPQPSYGQFPKKNNY